VDTELKAAINKHCHSKRLRRYELREENLSLKDLLSKARSLEISETQATGIEEKLSCSQSNSEGVNVVQGQQPKTKTQFRPRTSTSNTCRKCGLTWPHKGSPCPAKGQTCKKCGKPNHFARMCLTPTKHHRPQGAKENWKTTLLPVTDIQDDPSSSSDNEYVYLTR